MSATIRVRLNRLPDIPKAVERKCEAALLAGAGVVETVAKLKIDTGPKTGRIYLRGERNVSFKSVRTRTIGGESFGQSFDVSFTADRGKKKRTHQASAPGESPATDTGFLANSITHEKVGRLKARTYTSAEYAKALEFGSVDGKILARPFMAPAARESEDEIQALVTQAVQDGVK